MTQLLTIKNRISSVIIGGWGLGRWGAPLRDHLWQGPPLPVTLRLTQGIMTPRLLGGLRCSANGDELTRELLLISAPKPTPGHDRNGGAARPDAGVQYTSTGVS